MSNRYGITLDSEWIEWAAEEKVSDTVAAAVLLICGTRRLHDATLQGENPHDPTHPREHIHLA
jgi:hypothetical protein